MTVSHCVNELAPTRRRSDFVLLHSLTRTVAVAGTDLVVMSDLRSGKRKEFDASVELCSTAAKDSITEGSEHVLKQHKTFRAGVSSCMSSELSG